MADHLSTAERHAGERPALLKGRLTLPEQDLCRQILQQRYLQPGERHREDLFVRVAHALAQAEDAPVREQWASRFKQTLEQGGLVAGRILAGAGTGLHTTLVNCFVQPVGDCILGHDETGHPGIYEALGQAAETLRRGGGVGYDFSALRPRGALVRSTASLASGPCSYIDVFEQSCATVEMAGLRRGAQMAVLRIDHPDIHEFIEAKREPGRWRHFNLTVAVSDAFMQALAQGADWSLVHRASPGQAQMDQGAHWRDDGQWVYRTLPARVLSDALLHAAHDTAEPGVLFAAAVHHNNTLRHLDQIPAGEPCGAQPLQPHCVFVLGAA
ncbi:MAG: ribonucleoside-diphosphate reductase, adenosylcobalamin-dependent, partial [Limnohabitans sp.]